MPDGEGDVVLDADEALHDVSDDEWFDAHQALLDSGAIPESEGEFVWAPGVPGVQWDDRPQMTYVTDDDDA